MRRWLLLVMVLLLPLRGWVGEAMAGDMLERHLLAHASIAAEHHPGAHGQHHDHGHHAGHDGASAAPEAQPDAGGHGASCANCQVCSTVAFCPPPALVPMTSLHHAVPQGVLAGYTSADAAHAFKPPRS